MNPTNHVFRQRQRGSVLLTAQVFAIVLVAGLAAFAALARHTLMTAQRTFHVRDAFGLAESGLEEALDCFRQMDTGVAATTAWANWTLTGNNAQRTLAPMDRDQRALATVKVYVTGYNGTSNTAVVIAQATLAPFDGSAPVSRVVQLSLQKQNYFIRALVGRQGLTFSGQASTDSYNSNPTGSSTGPWSTYPGTGARANTLVIVQSGTISLSAQSAISGNLLLGAGVTPPPANKVSGTITTNFTGDFAMPAYPTAAGVTRSYNLGATIPASLPVTGHLPAADGRYYYFCTGATIANVTIAANRAVTIVGTSTSLGAGLALQTGASLSVYMDGAINAGNNAISNGNWAGALRIFTTTSASCTIGGNGSIYACVYAPNATLTCSGGGSTGMLVGSYVARTISSGGHMDIHYDEALQLPTAGSPWTINGWYERRSQTDRAALASLSANFLP